MIAEQRIEKIESQLNIGNGEPRPSVVFLDNNMHVIGEIFPPCSYGGADMKVIVSINLKAI